MAKTIIWNRTAQNVVHTSNQTLVFASAADANTWLNRNEKKQHPTTVYDLVTVT
jgi:hypothetical protein